MRITGSTDFAVLSNGVKMPCLGLGLFLNKNESEIDIAIRSAWNSGYKLYDTAAAYQNEEGVGSAIKKLNIDRNEIFVTSKVRNADQGYESTLKAFEDTLMRLDMDYLDLYLVHWPVKGKFKETWKAMETIYKSGKVRAIGVSNFLQHQLEDLLVDATVCPMVNQIEYHPWLTQPALISYCKEKGIKVQGWAPLMRGKVFEIPLIAELAKKYNRSIVQLVLRWNLQKGIMIIPKSVNEDRISHNVSIFDFSISNSDMQQIDDLNKNGRIGPDPDNFNF